ncbi:Hypp5504 [Branchiostoma lanceolatum]|uniref:Hypp5504 protein n=1 Tax=Branchiostoma lanceolatum TaxID=7740 RepID=A0A8J9W6B9_BRALA|nr:Hypp5504 [Branchiostoma lanceolatum]
MLRKLLINCYQRQKEEKERARNATLRSTSDSATVGASGDAGMVQLQEHKEGKKYTVEEKGQEEKTEGTGDKVTEKEEKANAESSEEIVTVEEIEIATTEEAIWELLEQYGPE